MDIIAFIEKILDPTWLMLPVLLPTQYARYVLLAILIVMVLYYAWREMVVKPVKETASIISAHRKAVHNALAALPDSYCVFDNVTVGKAGSYIAADRVVISPYGIFVIQEEYYTGIITGGDVYHGWKVNMYGHTTTIRNPANKAVQKCKGLSRLIGIAEEAVIPVVVFPDEAELRTATMTPVVIVRDLTATITGFEKAILTEEGTLALTNMFDMALYGDSHTEQ